MPLACLCQATGSSRERQRVTDGAIKGPSARLSYSDRPVSVGMPGWRRRGCMRSQRTGRTARSRSATRRPHRAGPARSRHGQLPRPAPRTGALRSAGRGRQPRAGTARAVHQGQRTGTTGPAPVQRPRRRGGTPRRERRCPAGAAGQGHKPAEKCQRPGLRPWSGGTSSPAWAAGEDVDLPAHTGDAREPGHRGSPARPTSAAMVRAPRFAGGRARAEPGMPVSGSGPQGPLAG